MVDSGITVSCGTDLPLLIPDIPESIYHASGGPLPRRRRAIQCCQHDEPSRASHRLDEERGLQSRGRKGSAGSLEEGKLADIVVFDRNLFALGMGEIRKAKVSGTYWRGKEVYPGSQNT